MDCEQYCVYPASAGGWLAQLHGNEQGPYHSCDMALRVAISEALCMRKSGHATRVTVMDAHGAVCAECCLCNQFPYRCAPISA